MGLNGFFPYLPQFMPDFNKIWHMGSTGNSVDRKWLSMKLVQWTPHFILSALGVFVLIPSFSRQISTKFGTEDLQAIMQWKSYFTFTFTRGLMRFFVLIPSVSHPISRKFCYWDWYDMIHLTAIWLTPGGSSTVHIYTQTIHNNV